MAKTYKALYEKRESDLYRNLVIGRSPDEELDRPSGLGGARPTQGQPEEEQSMFDRWATPILQRMGLYTDNPEQVANAIVPQTPTLPRANIGGPVEIRRWEDLPPPPSSPSLEQPTMDLTQARVDTTIPQQPTQTQPDALEMASREGSTRGPVPASQQPQSQNGSMVQRFVDEMEQLEGLDGDKLLGNRMPTYAYGITEEKANEYGMNPSDYDSMREFAEAFSERYMQEKEDTYSDIFANVSDEDRLALHSYLFNAGRFYDKQIEALNEGDMRGFIHEMRDVVNSEGAAVTGLSKRRAAEANMLGRNIEGWTPIAEVRVRGTTERPIFDWVDADGNVIESHESDVPLHSGSTMNPVSVPQFD